MSAAVLLGVDVAHGVLSYVGTGSFLFVTITKTWRQAHSIAFSAANTKTVVAAKDTTYSQMHEVLSSDAPHKMDLMNILARKGLFTFALMASDSPYFMHMFSPKTFCFAAYSGNYDMTTFIGRRVWGWETVEKHVGLCAAEGGCVKIIRFLFRENHMPARGTADLAGVYDAMVHVALEHGRLEVLDLLLNDISFKADIGGIEWIGWGDIFGALAGSARAGDTRTLDWFGVHCGVKGCDDVTGLLCTEAAKKGQFETLKFLKSRGYHLSNRAFSACGRVGNAKMLRWMVDNGCPTDSAIFVDASMTGNLAAIEWAKEYGLVPSSQAVDTAKYCGNYMAMLAMQGPGRAWS